MKRSMKTVILLGVLALFIGGYYLVSSLTQTQSVTEEEGAFALSDISLDTLAGMSWTRDETEYHFVQNEEGLWEKSDDAAFPVNQEALEALAEDLTGLEATRRLENVGELADYGLEEPVFSLTAQLSDGSSLTYAMGDETAFADGFYMSVSNEEGVLYIVEDSLDDLFSDNLTALAQLEEIPEAESYDRLVVGTALDATYVDDSVSLDPAQHWYVTGTSEALDGDALEGLADALNGLTWQELVEYNASQDALAQYGLTDAATALSLLSGEETQRSVLIGAEDDNGDFYARLPDSSMVYLVSSDSVSDLLDAGVETLFEPTLVGLPADNLSRMTFALSGSAQERVVERTVSQAEAAEETAEEAEPTEDVETTEEAETGEDVETTEEVEVFTVDGVEADAQTVKDAYALLTALEGTARVEDNADGECLLEVSVLGDAGQSLTVRFLSYDVDSYLASTGGDYALLVPASDVDTLIRSLRQLP